MNLCYTPTTPYQELGSEDDYLYPIIQATKVVVRYKVKEYPDGLIGDNVFDHTIRLITLASQIGLDQNSQEELDRMLLVHDLPEVELGDIPIVYAKAKVLQEPSEMEIAKKILNDKDFALYVKFDFASRFLKGEVAENPDPIALIAKVLDSIEGNMFFHFHLQSWIASEKPSLPAEMNHAFTHTFEQYRRYRQSISTLEDESTKRPLIELLGYEIKFISELWMFDQKGIPEPMRKFLE